jgi:hypothetical protein
MLKYIQMKQFVLIIAFLPFLPVHGQKPMPGGVQGACLWEITESMQPGQARWRSYIENPFNNGLTVQGKYGSINNNPALLFPGSAGTINSTLDLGGIPSFSLFTVCQEIDTLSEKVIVSLENDTAAEMVLTNRRMAALEVYRYANFDVNRKLYPRIYSYTQNKSRDRETVARRLQFGRAPHTQHLPVSAYSGLIPEVILFERDISPRERRQVESYLALKYGISLNQQFPVSYLSSSGEVIWDAEMHAAYNQNIAGIGSDDLSGLYQRVSESTQSPGVMKIGVTGELGNNSFMIWGDNGRSLSFAEESGIRKLQREWKITANNFKSGSVWFETNELALSDINPLSNGEIYWMMVDHSGTGRYPFRQTAYVPCMPLSSSEGCIRFNAAMIDSDRSGDDVFTLLAAPPFFTRSSVLPPGCSSLQSGTIQTEIAGGEPPYELTLKGISNNNFLVSASENKMDHVFEGISQGAYILQVTDSRGKTFTEDIWVANSHLWETRVSRNYNLIEGETIELDASAGMPAVNYTYAWTAPGGSCVNSEKMTIDTPGDYLLSITDENHCNSTLEIKVRQIGKSNFKNVVLFPNPTGEWFTVRINLERTADVNVTITDMSGIILKQTLLQNERYYWYNDKLRHPGIYLITLVTGSENETLTLIVQ